MRPIGPALVDEVWRDISRYPPERVQAEARGFLEQQPHVATFAAVLMKQFEEPVQQAAFGLCFLLFKVLEQSLGRPFPLLAEERIQQAYEANVGWLSGTEAGAESLLDTLPAGAHASLLSYIMSVFYGGDGGHDTQVKTNLFLLLKTLTEALDIGAVDG
ncbi:MAG: hypothetical protein AUH29_05645 [Candidatus Rokubacteria bacterium 13_1_40CM_69_27]|nr:MAG: hypothetical protein AUH29_05645 [Candidatus Rokubacteria bacterium 13_1_40CM_69_27]OLC32477.1 MAG: hypothetical protein AUH81_16190 [Candidatus Rokubacteria bacterium 13_1_40CM_4_69_5]OLE38160.1 MAG: hypothetical protein AUG00_06100 [Candidatus Rokubacteria bacterium 13_1_20CM_2_70_7]